MSLVVGGMYWRLNGRRKAYQGWSLSLKSLGATTMDVHVLTNDLSRKKSVTLGLHLGKLKYNFRWVAFHVLGIVLSSSSYSLYASLSRLVVTLNGPS